MKTSSIFQNVSTVILVITPTRHPWNPTSIHISAAACCHVLTTALASGLLHDIALAYLLVWLIQTKKKKSMSCIPTPPPNTPPPPQQNKFNNYISLSRNNYSPMCQMNNFVCLTTKSKPQVLRDNPENQAELWPLPQNKHLSKQMDLVLKIYNK